jgi:hypothetical protein
MVTPHSLYFVDPAGSGELRLAYATYYGAFLTR